MNRFKHLNKRAIIITENEQIIFRFDNHKVNESDFIERDIFNALIDLEKKGDLDLIKLFSMFKVFFGLGLMDCLNIVKTAIFDRHSNKWCILTEDDFKEE